MAGFSNQGNNAIALGRSAGRTTQGSYAIALGREAGNSSQGSNAIALGPYAGNSSQGNNAIALGRSAGFSNQGSYAIALGREAGNSSQGNNAIALGRYAGRTTQGNNAIALGPYAGRTTQGNNAIALGQLAGNSSQGIYAIALGFKAGETNQSSNSIILNADSTSLNSTTTGFFVNPIRSLSDSDLSANTLTFNTATKEILYNTTKTFVIQHPIEENKYLVHACLEGPEAGIYYRGETEITNNLNVTIELPDYAKAIGTEFTSHITPVYSNGIFPTNICVTKVIDGKFTVYGTNGLFNWVVYGLRNKINVEPLKSETVVNGNGPYKYVV